MDCYCDETIGNERAVRYRPGARVVEVSEPPRWIDAFVRRRPLQERLIYRIAPSLQDMVKPRRVAMVTEAAHGCLSSRGVNRRRVSLVARGWLSDFCEDSVLRRELLEAFLLAQRGRREG